MAFDRSVLPASILMLLTLYHLWASLRPRTSKLPRPRGFPIVGYLPSLGPNLHRTLAELARQYGPRLKLRLGSKVCVVPTSPSLAKEVCPVLDAVFSNRDVPAAARATTCGGIDISWCPYGPQWRCMSKQFVREMLSKSSLDACHHLRRDEIRSAVRNSQGKFGASVDIGNVTFETQINLAMRMIWGGTLEDREAKRVGAEFRAVTAEIMELLGTPNVSDLLPGLARFDLQGVGREMKRLVLCVEEIFDSVIDARVKMGGMEKKRKVDFLQILLEL